MSATAAYGTIIYIKTTGSSFGGGDEINGVNKNSIKINGTQLDVTKFKGQLAWQEFVQGLKGASIDLSGFVDRGDAPQNLIRTKLLTPGALFCEILSTPGGSTGSKGFVAAVNVESYTEDGDVAGLQNWSSTLRVTGAVAVDS